MADHTAKMKEESHDETLDGSCGCVCAMLEFQTAVEEIFDVQLLGGIRFPDVMGFQKDTIHHTFVVPPEERPPQFGDRSFSAS